MRKVVSNEVRPLWRQLRQLYVFSFWIGVAVALVSLLPRWVGGLPITEQIGKSAVFLFLFCWIVSVAAQVIHSQDHHPSDWLACDIAMYSTIMAGFALISLVHDWHRDTVFIPVLIGGIWLVEHGIHGLGPHSTIRREPVDQIRKKLRISIGAYLLTFGAMMYGLVQ